MMEIVHVIEHTLIDIIEIAPFLLIAFLLLELIEHRFNNKVKQIITKSGKLGPIIGAIAGSVPQCGFSLLATNLYVTRIISLGTLISIYLATSDEMLPVLLSQNVEISLIIKIILIKIIIGMIVGILIDIIIRKKKKMNYKICNQEQCECEESIIKSTIIHTLKTISYLFIITFILNIILEYVDIESIQKIFTKNIILAPFISSLIGLIPNCASCIMITELYLSGFLSLGTAIGGLLTGSGVALAVLIKNNDNKKETFMIIGILYIVGVISGILLNIIL